MRRPAHGRTILALAALLALAGCASSPDTPYARELHKASRLNAQLGANYLQRGNLQQAKEKIDKALDQDPDNPEAHAAAALLNMRLNEPATARRHFETALELDPSRPQVQNNFGTFLCEHGENARGMRYFLKAAENPLYDTPAYAYANAGRCAREAGRIDDARQHLRSALDVDPRMASALYALAELEMDEGRVTHAGRYIERYHGVANAGPESLWLAIRIQRALGNAEAARKHGMRLLRDFPDTVQADRFLETR